MCTLSWTWARDGFWVFFNRDERLTRLLAQPPTPASLGGIRYLAPADGDHGGTWIGVNQLGLAAALLNRYEDAPLDPAAGRISRGLLLRSHLDSRSAGELIGRLNPTALEPYRPFTIAAFDLEMRVRLADWNGRTLVASETDRPGLVRTSSGRDQATAERIRGQVFGALGQGRPTARALRELHRSHRPERGPFSICMHRQEAATQSMTEIRVTRGAATIRYRAGSPCVTPVTTVGRLARR